MTAAAVPSGGPGGPGDLGPMETIGGRGKPSRASAKGNRPKLSAGSAWSTWQSEGSVAARDEFLPNIASWSQGTAAQLLRQAWPVDSKRPTVMAVEARLHHHLGVIAKGEPTTYLDALETARQAVIEELKRARLEVDPDR